jgi:5'-3' exonuclease
MNNELLAFDMSSYMWRALLAAKDAMAIKVEHEGKTVSVNTAEYGYENIINAMTKVLRELKANPIDMILVFEGMSSKVQRELIDPTYKATRDSRPDEAYVQFQRLKEMMETTWRNLGATLVTQDYVEGDDVLGWLAMNVDRPLTVCSYDWDLAWCNMDCNPKGARIQVWNDGLIGVNKYGLFNHHLITTYKALVGDDKDNIKGCPNFGVAAFEKFCEAYGFDGLQELQDMLEAGFLSKDLHDMAQENVGTAKNPKPAHPLIRKICDNEEQVVRSYRLAKIHYEWVNTLSRPLQWKAGMVRPAQGAPDERLAKWYGTTTLVTADNYEQKLSYAASLVAQSPFVAFDIETSSADESDDWLAAQGDPDGVDQMGSTLTGFSVTLGNNTQHTFYVSVDHADTNNITMSQARRFLEAVLEAHKAAGRDTVIHNSHFELPVLYEAQDEDGTLWRDRWRNNGSHGFIPRMLDTKLEASYVNENEKLGLKHRSSVELGYKQTEYDEVTTLMEPHLLPGGRHLGYKQVLVKEAVTEKLYDENDPDGGFTLREIEPASYKDCEIRRYKMNELPAKHVFAYGCDDTICTAALHVHYRLICGLEGTWDIYKLVEIGAAYQHAKNFIDGIAWSLERSKELEATGRGASCATS